MKRAIFLLLITALTLSWSCNPKKTTTQEVSSVAAPTAGETTPVETKAPEQQTDPSTLPLDPAVTIGKLDNGFTYYIRENQKPENRAEIRLVVNAGSIQEDDDQRGLAHFVEHMAFNGTRNFEKQELVDYIESIGMRFGPDLNASTNFDRTLYQLQVPMDNPETLETAFLIMEDWAHGITFEGEEIDKERGVVIEEWRGRRGAGARMFDKQLPVLLKGSRYTERLPIGTKETLETAPHDAIRRFYRDWYRPDLMALIVVGEVDTAKIEALVKKHFTKLKNPEKPRPREYYPVPNHEETLFTIVSDPEMTSTTVQVTYKHEIERIRTKEDYRRAIVSGLHRQILNQRLSELTQAADPPFLAAYSGESQLVRTKSSYLQVARVKEDGILRGLEALMTEAERVKRHGFTQTELDRSKKLLMRYMESAYEERDKENSRSYVYECINHYLDDQPMLSVEEQLKLYQEFLPEITLDEVNHAGDKMITQTNRVIQVQAPEKEGLALPDEQALLAGIKQAAAKDIQPYEDKFSEEPLVANPPKPGRIVEEKTIEAIGVTELKLSNGVRVVLKPTDFKNDEINYSAFSEGGSSLAPDDDFEAVDEASSIINESGVGTFDKIQLTKKTSGKVAFVRPGINSRFESMGGFASPKDMETLFQLTYLYFTEPRIDETAFQSLKTKWLAALENREKNPQAVFFDKISETMSQNHPRAKSRSKESIEKIDLNKSIAFYKDRFSDAGDFTFIFVGNLELEKMKPLIETYLGGLPATGRKETWRDLGIRPPKGHVEVSLNKGLEEKSQVRLIFTGEAEWSPFNNYEMDSMIAALSMRLREVMREDMGGVYGVSVRGNISRHPVESYQITISFGCAPENVDALIEAAHQEIKAFKEKPLEASYVEKVHESQIRSRETSIKQNRYWLVELLSSYQNNLDPTEILDYEEWTKKLDAEMIQRTATKYFDMKNYVKAVLMPEAQ